MGIRPGGERGCPGGRGQSSVIGVVLILGLVITSMTVIATVGGLALLNTEDELSVARAEKVMTQFDSQSALVALGETNARQTQLIAGNDGRYTLDEDAGWMRISIRNTSANATGNPTRILNSSSLGAMVYETDGVRIAYQGGGVWKKGDGEAVMVSPPEFHYRGQTLTLPVINVTGDDQVSGQVNVRQGSISQEYPNETFVNPVPAEREVVVTVKSEYYRGWGTYFERRTDGNVSYDDAKRTASITLTVPIEENFNNAVTATGNVKSKNVEVNGTVEEGATRPSASGLIDDKIEACESGSCDPIPADGEFDAGTYYSSSDVDLKNDTTFDTSSGNIDLIVNGSLDFGPSDHEITGDGNVTIYLKGNLGARGNARINSEGNPADLLTYVHSDAGALTVANGNPQYKGLIYSPNTDLTIKGGGKCKNGGGNGNGGGNKCNGNIVGGVVVEDITSSSNGKIRGSENIGITLEFAESAAITYLHISENRVEIKDS